jgi:FMN-dependent oxidoreductase (nitrilotriacetate monooxygenase family)
MKLGAYISPGGHHAGWRHPEADPNPSMSFDVMLEQTQTAERGKMDAVFFPDTIAMNGSTALANGDQRRAYQGRCVFLEPVTLLPALAALTTHIGLIATVTTTYNEPYSVARRFATIDHISKGRAGWNLVTSQIEDESWNFGREHHMEHGLRYERAGEFYDVVAGLWDSWEEDALVLDKASGQYFDAAKLHFLNHDGKHFKVRGPLNVTRTPQGRPVVAQAGSSNTGRDLAARTADIVFTAQGSLKESQDFYIDVKSRAALHKRSPDSLAVMPGLLPIVGGTEEEAQRKLRNLQDMLSDELALSSLKLYTGDVDLSQYPLDGPLPELPLVNTAQSRQKMLIEMGRSGKTIRDIARYFAVNNGQNFIAGTPAQIADHMQHWVNGKGADGFNILAPFMPTPLRDFVDHVIPELQRRGAFRTDYESDTLRGNLGLPMPANRYS